MVSTCNAERVPQDWINAIIWVESRGDTKAVGDNGKAFGCLQIHKAVVIDVNERYGTNYTHEDCFDYHKAIEILQYYIHRWATFKRTGYKTLQFEIVARMWNGGGVTGHRRDTTEIYWQKVKLAHEGLQEGYIKLVIK